MLDDDAGSRRDRSVEGLDAFPGRVGIGDVVVGQFLALDLLIAGDAAGHHARLAVERRLLVRVFAVAQGFHLVESELQPFGEDAGLVLLVERGQPVGDGGIVARGLGEGLLGQGKSRLV